MRSTIIMHKGKVFTRLKIFTQKEVQNFGVLVGDLNPVHHNAIYARSTLFKQPIVHGPFLGSLFGGLISANIPHSIYLHQNLRFDKPVFLDEEVLVRVEVKDEKQTSKGTRLVLETMIHKRGLPKEDGSPGEFNTVAVFGDAGVLVLSNVPDVQAMPTGEN